MQNLWCTRTWGVTLVVSWPWEQEGPMSNKVSKNWTPRVQLRPILLDWTMYWPRWSGTDTSWKSRDMSSMTMLSINITRAPSNYKRMVGNKVARGQDRSISGIILSLIESKSMRHMGGSVPLWTWSGIISQRHCRDLNFIAFVISFLVSMKMKIPTVGHFFIRPEKHNGNRYTFFAPPT